MHKERTKQSFLNEIKRESEKDPACLIVWILTPTEIQSVYQAWFGFGKGRIYVERKHNAPEKEQNMYRVAFLGAKNKESKEFETVLNIVE